MNSQMNRRSFLLGTLAATSAYSVPHALPRQASGEAATSQFAGLSAQQPLALEQNNLTRISPWLQTALKIS